MRPPLCWWTKPGKILRLWRGTILPSSTIPSPSSRPGIPLPRTLMDIVIRHPSGVIPRDRLGVETRSLSAIPLRKHPREYSIKINQQLKLACSGHWLLFKVFIHIPFVCTATEKKISWPWKSYFLKMNPWMDFKNLIKIVLLSTQILWISN